MSVELVVGSGDNDGVTTVPSKSKTPFPSTWILECLLPNSFFTISLPPLFCVHKKINFYAKLSILYNLRYSGMSFHQYSRYLP